MCTDARQGSASSHQRPANLQPHAVSGHCLQRHIPRGDRAVGPRVPQPQKAGRGRTALHLLHNCRQVVHPAPEHPNWSAQVRERGNVCVWVGGAGWGGGGVCVGGWVGWGGGGGQGARRQAARRTRRACCNSPVRGAPALTGDQQAGLLSSMHVVTGQALHEAKRTGLKGLLGSGGRAELRMQRSPRGERRARRHPAGTAAMRHDVLRYGRSARE